MEIQLQFKRLDVRQLREELAAVGVSLPTGFDSVLVEGDRVTIRVPDGTDTTTVRQVYQRHNPPPDKTPTQIKRERLVESLSATDTQSERLKVVIRVLYKSLVETRAWCNQIADSLQAAGMPTPPRLRNRTWEQAVQAVMEEIESEVQP